MKSRISLAKPHMLGNERKYMDDAYDSNWIAPLGPYVTKFEEDMCEYTGAKAAVATSSGTAAIHIALRLAGVKAGDTVLCADMTFAASANPIVYLGAKPVFIDCELDTFGIDLAELEFAIVQHKPKAVILVHVYGIAAKYLEEIVKLCKDKGVVLIEDATEALGSTYKGKMLGTFGDYGCYSFNGNKIITTAGGGMIVSDNEEAMKKALYYATQAKEPVPYYLHNEVGYNYRMSNINAAIGCGQLERIATKIRMKRAIHERYAKGFADETAIAMHNACNCYSNMWLSVAWTMCDPAHLVAELEKENIEARRVWKPLHSQPCYNYEAGACTFDGSRYVYAKCVCLPSDTNMTVEEQERVIYTVKNILRRGGAFA